jgi:hypothetical protein
MQVSVIIAIKILDRFLVFNRICYFFAISPVENL